MLEKPLSVDPVHIFGLKCVGVEYTCNGCGAKFNCEDGVVLKDHFFDKEKNLHYGYLAFCDTLCILENWCIKGNA